MARMEMAAFRRTVWNHYRKNGRHNLPWRTTRNPYRILVSEIMLQQTQVERVRPFYAKFLTRFPDVKALAAATLSEVIAAWQGLGYNRRAKMLHACAKEIVRTGGKFPRTTEELEMLPGIGPYTARAVAAFAFNEDGVLIETNIRTVVIHHFFARTKKILDAEIEKILAKALPKGKAREWYAALMDYGAFLKRSGISHNERSKGYAKQKAFAGSVRQARGALLKELVRRSATRSSLLRLLGKERQEQVQQALQALVREGIVMHSRGRYTLAD